MKTPARHDVTTYLIANYNLDYFDSLISAQCIIRNTKPLTIDREMIEAPFKRDKILSTLRKQLSFSYILPCTYLP